MNRTKKYFRHRIEKIITVSKIVSLGRFSFENEFSSKGEAHDFWEMIYAASGGVICTVGREESSLGEGEVLFHQPDEYHAFRTEKEIPAEVVVITFECRSENIDFFAGKHFRLPSELLPLLDCVISEGERTFNITPPDPYSKKIELLKSPTLGGLQLITNYLEILLINLIRFLTETPRGNSVFLPEKEFEGKLSEEIKRLLKDNICASITVDELCRQTHYSRSYLFSTFRKTAGKSIMQYYTEIKIRRAKELINEGMTVSEISKYLSFDTPNYFSKTFKRVTGETPSEYRGRIRSAKSGGS